MKLTTQKIEFGDIDSVTFDKIKLEESKPAKNQYVNNKELQAAFVLYHAKKMKWLEEERGLPPLSDTIGQAILDIATRRTFSRNFIGYTQAWKEEMIGDAIETCVRYCHNYDPTRYNNPFAYITQLVTNAIIQRIKREKIQTYIKHKAFDNAGGFSAEMDENISEDDVQVMAENSDMYSDCLSYIADFESKYLTKPPKEIVDESQKGLLLFLRREDLDQPSEA